MTVRTMELHAALIWGGEPIADVTLSEPGPITIGPAGGTTFTVPELGLPDVFPIVKPGHSGYLLTLGHAMGGTVSLGGERRAVGELVGDAPFAATAIAPGDWGVIDLDGTGALQLFFQVAPAAEKLAPARGFDLDTVLPAAAFSVLLHLVLLIITYRASTGDSPFTWPGPRELTGAYLVQRIEPVKAPTPTPVIVAALPPSSSPQTATQIPPPKKQPVIKHAAEGATPQITRQPRHDDEDADEPPTRSPGAGLTTPENMDLLNRMSHQRVDTSKWTAKPGRGHGRIGDGPGDGTGHDEIPGDTHGKPEGVGWKPQGDIDTDLGPDGDGHGHGHGRHGPGTQGTGPTETQLDPPTTIVRSPDTSLSDKEIEAGIHARSGVFRACYQKYLDRGAGHAGTVTTKFTISPDGKITAVSIEGNSTQDSDLATCISRTLRSLVHYRATTNGGLVRYPFILHGGS